MTESNRPPFEQEVDLLEYIARVLQAKYRLIGLSVCMAAITLGITFLMPNLYTATATVAFNRYDQPGGVKPMDYRGSDTVALLERDMVIDISPENEKDRLLTRMSSYDFLSLFIEQQQLGQFILPDQWDDEKKVWKAGDNKSHSMQEAVRTFNEKILHLAFDKISGLMKIHITTNNPEMSAKLANEFVFFFKEYQKNLILTELSNRRDYLENSLKKTSNLEFQRSIYRMLETQLSAEALIHVRSNYPIEMITPALPPLIKSSPKRLLFSMIAFIATLFIGVSYLIGSVIYEKTARELKKYTNRPTSLPGSMSGTSDNAAPASLSNHPHTHLHKEADTWVDPHD